MTDSSEARGIINRAHRLAYKLNVPAVAGVLDRVADEEISLDDVKRELGKVSLWKKVSLANSLRRRALNDSDSLYTVRNGRAFAKRVEREGKFLNPLRQAKLAAIEQSIVDDIRPVVEGKSILIPDEMDYAFPTSEKMFIGTIPFFSTLSLPKGAVIGIHWMNVDNGSYVERVDLDLHYTSPCVHVGWNTGFDDDDRRLIIHTMDMTDAPIEKGGAAEAVYIPEGTTDFAAVTVNRYSGNSVGIPYTLFVGGIGNERISEKYILSARETAVTVNGLEMTNNQDFLGFVESNADGQQIYFCKTGLGSSIVTSYSSHMEIALNAVKAMTVTRLSLRSMLERAGARFDLSEDDKGWDIDLSVSALTKDSWAFLTTK